MVTHDSVNFFVLNSGTADCNGDLGGTAFIDDCGVCAGGNTGKVPNADKDTCGVCNGDGSSCAGSGGSGGGSIPGSGAAICGNFPGGRIAMASDGNAKDADDHGATAMALAMLHYSGLMEKLVYVGHSSLYKSGCNNSGGNWCDIMDSVSLGTLMRFGYDTSIVYDYYDDYDDNNQLDQSITAFTAAIDASSPGDSRLDLLCQAPWM
ncbi:MAG: hypothetical protein U5L96_09450 [Owenweeksia sp.]|nr:hypothetical protein [Owenweeksia sp.]